MKYSNTPTNTPYNRLTDDKDCYDKDGKVINTPVDPVVNKPVPTDPLPVTEAERAAAYDRVVAELAAVKESRALADSERVEWRKNRVHDEEQWNARKGTLFAELKLSDAQRKVLVDTGKAITFQLSIAP